MTTVSYSESSSYLSCKRKHWYGYTRSLQRVSESSSLQLGKAGHALLETYYRSILSEGDTLKEQRNPEARKRAEDATLKRYNEIIEEGFVDDPRKASLWEIVFEFYLPNEPLVQTGWIIQAVEKEFRLDVEADGQTVGTPFVIDLIALDPTGKTVVVDHKFVYDFYTYEVSELQPQIPLYIAGLRGLGYHVDHGFYNMLRNRAIRGTKDKNGEYPGATWEQRYYGIQVTPTPTRVRRTFEDQIDTAVEIQSLKELDPEEQDRKAVRVANNMVCKSCSFADLCKIELRGGNAALVLRAEYKTRVRKTFTVSEDAKEIETD